MGEALRSIQHAASPAVAKRKAGLQMQALEPCYWVYILASRRNGTLYVGMTNDLPRRVEEHREGIASRFTKRYAVTRLVYFEGHDRIEEARAREYRVKKWKRPWKLDLIEALNPDWDDLWLTLNQ